MESKKNHMPFTTCECCPSPFYEYNDSANAIAAAVEPQALTLDCATSGEGRGNVPTGAAQTPPPRLLTECDSVLELGKDLTTAFTKMYGAGFLGQQYSKQDGARPTQKIDDTERFHLRTGLTRSDLSDGTMATATAVDDLSSGVSVSGNATSTCIYAAPVSHT